MRRLNLFAKGNVDLRDSLLYARVGGEVRWNGINEVVRRRFPGNLVRVRHETWTRSDALLEASTRGVPEGLQERRLPLGPYSVESQFSRALLDAPGDVVVLSVQPDVMTPMARHRRDGYLFYPNGWGEWPADARGWLRQNFEDVGRIDVRSSIDHLGRICRAIRERSRAPILIYNMSYVVPGELVHNHEGLGEILSTRIRRFNLALIGLSEELGVSVVDVDAIVARGGADRLKVDAVHLTPEGHRLVAEEIVRILEELGCFDGAGGEGPGTARGDDDADQRGHPDER